MELEELERRIAALERARGSSFLGRCFRTWGYVVVAQVVVMTVFYLGLLGLTWVMGLLGRV